MIALPLWFAVPILAFAGVCALALIGAAVWWLYHFAKGSWML